MGGSEKRPKSDNEDDADHDLCKLTKQMKRVVKGFLFACVLVFAGARCWFVFWLCFASFGCSIAHVRVETAGPR